MKLYRKNLNQLCIITWKDAKGDMNVTLAAFLKDGWEINTTVGWLIYFDNEKIVLATEKSELCEGKDLVWIPKGWETKIEFIEE